MAGTYEIPRNMHRYLKRIATEYKRKESDDLSSVIESSKFRVIEETAYDNWNGGIDGHDLVLYVPDELMGYIPLDDQQDIQNKMREDLNKASSAAQREYVNDVHFEYLDESDDEIARASSLSTPFTSQDAKDRIWKSDSIKLFISHRDTHKADAHSLAEHLTEFGVSSFVAHDSIEPDEEWQGEIEKALQSMDVLLAFITDDLFDSAWTNQEIGFALGRSIPIVSIKVSTKDPVGFINKRQAINGKSDSQQENAKKIWATIEKRLSGKPIFNKAIIQRFINSNSFKEAKERFFSVAKLGSLTEDQIASLVDAFNTNDQISGSYGLKDGNWFLKILNQSSSKTHAISNNKVVIVPPKTEDEIPF